MADAFQATLADGVFSGPVRAPRNSAKHLGAGSIHDDATAQKLGFRGGTVAGSLHMDQFPPLLLQALGDDWLRSGGMSLYFKYATTDGEPVQAFCAAPTPDSRRIPIWMDDAQGHRVCDGTANLGGEDLESLCRQRLNDTAFPKDIRILAALSPGDTSPAVPTRISAEALARRLPVITEPLPGYQDPSLFGHLLAPPSLQVQALRAGESLVLQRDKEFGVGLFGAIELQALAGPVLVDYPYETFTKVLLVGETPKTEFFWYQSDLLDPNAGTTVARMLMMLRFMKASSAHWR